MVGIITRTYTVIASFCINASNSSHKKRCDPWKFLEDSGNLERLE